MVGLGCWQFGDRSWGYGSEFGERDAAAIIQRALELGVTVFDTAELYGRGESERIVGRALRDAPTPPFLVSKFLPAMPLPSNIVSHCRRSVERLGVEALDLYLIHFPNPIVPLALQMRGLRQVLELGLSRHVGVSNFTLAQWKVAERHLGKPLWFNQVRYNLLQRKPERATLPYAQSKGRFLMAYSPLAQGALTGKYGPGNVPGGVRRTNPLFTDQALRSAGRVVRLLGELAVDRGCTPAQVALAYLIAQRQVLVIPGAKSVQQLEQNVAAADISLSGSELGALGEAAAGFRVSPAQFILNLPKALLGSPDRNRPA